MKSRTQQSLAARLLLQRACNEANITLSQTQAQLPRKTLQQQLRPLGWNFSIAHCRGLCAVALGRSELGVDCEPLAQNRNWSEIAKAFFTPEEAQYIKRQTGSQQKAAFLHHWVLKEAYIKGIEGGLFGDLNKLTLTANATAFALGNAKTTLSWQCWRAEINGYFIGLASKLALTDSKPIPIKIRHVATPDTIAKPQAITWLALTRTGIDL